MGDWHLLRHHLDLDGLRSVPDLLCPKISHFDVVSALVWCISQFNSLLVQFSSGLGTPSPGALNYNLFCHRLSICRPNEQKLQNVTARDEAGWIIQRERDSLNQLNGRTPPPPRPIDNTGCRLCRSEFGRGGQEGECQGVVVAT